MNEQIKEALKKFARDVAVAFVGLVLALAAVFGIVFPSQSTEELVAGVTNQKITANRAGDTMTFASGAQLKAAAGSTVVFAGDFQPTVIRVNGTPVVPFATPQPTYAYTAPTAVVLYGNTPAAVKEICKTVNIIGSATVTFPGITTPQAVGPITFNDSGLGNADLATFVNASGVITINTYRNVAQTPVAATTVVAVDVCAKGN